MSAALARMAAWSKSAGRVSVQCRRIRFLGTDTAKSKAERIADAAERRVLSLFARAGHIRRGSATISEQSLRAANVAAFSGDSKEAVVAGLLHSVGDLLLHEVCSSEVPEDGSQKRIESASQFLKSLGFCEDVYSSPFLHSMQRDSNCSVTSEMYNSVDELMPIVRSVVEESVTVQLEHRTNTTVSEYAEAYVLSPDQVSYFNKYGYLIVHDALKDFLGFKELDTMATEAQSLPTPVGAKHLSYPWILHHERSSIDGNVQICRVENFCKHHRGWSMLNSEILNPIVSQAFGEPAALFKDKINYKGPGGGGFFAHQDATAYATEKLATRHISVLVGIDQATPLNGPLEVPGAPGQHLRGILPNKQGVTDPKIEAESEPWTPILAEPGQIVLFDSFLPHRSSENKSKSWRRSAYITYNMLREGDLHDAYYEAKANAWKQGTAGPISINNDFGGDIV